MIEFNKYPHVRDLILYYATDTKKSKILGIMKNGLSNSEDATSFSIFIWFMIDRMSEDSNSNKEVFGRIDNTDMLPDLEYEISLYMENMGYISEWEKVSDDENSE